MSIFNKKNNNNLIANNNLFEQFRKKFILFIYYKYNT